MAERIQIGPGIEGPGQALCSVQLLFTLEGQTTARSVEIFNPTSPVHVEELILAQGQNMAILPGPPQQAYAALIFPPEGMTTEAISLLGENGGVFGIPMHNRAPMLLTFTDQTEYPPAFRNLYFKVHDSVVDETVDLVDDSPNPGKVEFPVPHGLTDGRRVQFIYGNLPPEVRPGVWYYVKVVGDVTVNLYTESPDNCLIFSADGSGRVHTPNRLRIYWF